MKLQIVEYKLSDPVNMCDRYRYTLELDGRALLQFESTEICESLDFVKMKFMIHLRLLTDYDLEHYKRFNVNKLTGIDKKVIFEREVSDHYLKDLKIQRRIEDLKRDFEE